MTSLQILHAGDRAAPFRERLHESNTGDAILLMHDATINLIELEIIREWTFPLEAFIIKETD